MTDGSGQQPGKRVGVLGGTFDPVHIGHLVAAGEAAAVVGLDEILFVPTGVPWQKPRGITSGVHRVRMTEIAVAGNERFAVSSVDVTRAGPTYTVDTLRDLRAGRPPDTEWFLLAGADTLAGLPTWKDAEEVVRLATLVGITRPGHRLASVPWPGVPVLPVQMPGLDVSSRECRDRLRRGGPVRYLIPDGVLAYIEKNGLYRGTAG